MIRHTTVILVSLSLFAVFSDASAGSLSIQQNSSTNKFHVIQLQNSHADVNKVITGGSASNSITHVVQVRNELSPISVSQIGKDNVVRAKQRGQSTDLYVYQSGETNRAYIRQNGISLP